MDKRKKKRLIRWIVAMTVTVIIAVVATVIVTVFKVDTYVYKGNVHYTDEELTDKLFGGYTNSLWYWLFGKNSQKNIAFIQKTDVEMEWPNKMVVTVYEKSVIGYISYMGSNMYFDKDGIVVESSSTVLKEVPQVIGLKFDSIILNQKLMIGDDSIYNRLLEVTQTCNKYEINIDKVYFDSNKCVTLYMGDVKVLLGECDELTDRLYQLKQVSDKLQGWKGTLHLENYGKDNDSVIFKKDE